MTGSALIFVLGTSHRLQGSPSFPDSVEGSDYTNEISSLISTESIDFIFEEAGGKGQTTTARLADSRKIQYRDMDVEPQVSGQVGPASFRQVGPVCESSLSAEELVEDQNKREERWCERIVEQDFTSGLVICGYHHALSISFRLRAAGLGVKYYVYLPHDKLCSHHKTKTRERG